MVWLPEDELREWDSFELGNSMGMSHLATGTKVKYYRSQPGKTKMDFAKGMR